MPGKEVSFITQLPKSSRISLPKTIVKLLDLHEVNMVHIAFRLAKRVNNQPKSCMFASSGVELVI